MNIDMQNILYKLRFQIIYDNEKRKNAFIPKLL